jgi:SAM-dependent methyltransferase
MRFGEDPDVYDRTRPVAPDVVFDDVERLGGLDAGSTVAEIGPGTGQATRQLAKRGLRIVALEIDDRLAARARQNLADLPDVSVSATSFETWDPRGMVFDAVFACNSFHWVDPDVRFVKAASVLDRDGHLVVLSTPVVVPAHASRFWWDVQDDWEAVGSGRLDPATLHPDRVDDLVTAFRSCGLFEEATATRHRFDVSYTAEDYVANLSTQSGVKGLPVEAQPVFLERVRRRIDALGGTLLVHHLAVVTAAQVA